MIPHIGPQAAITLAQQTAVKFQTSNEASPEPFVRTLMGEIESVLNHEAVTPADYLNALRAPAKLETVTAGGDELSQRRATFFRAYLEALEARAATI
jgi:hypothetical protein